MKVWMVTLIDGTSYHKQPRSFEGLFETKRKAIASLPAWAHHRPSYKTTYGYSHNESWGADGWSYYITEEEVI